MKNLLRLTLLLISVNLISCINQPDNVTRRIKKETVVEKEIETKTEVVEVEKENPNLAFIGNYISADGLSFISITVDADELIRIESTGQVLTTMNKNKTYGTHPVISVSRLNSKDGKILILNRNNNYSSSTHDLEADKTTSNITGNRRTDVVISKSEYGISINIKIFEGAVNSNVNKVILNRTIELQ